MLKAKFIGKDGKKLNLKKGKTYKLKLNSINCTGFSCAKEDNFFSYYIVSIYRKSEICAITSYGGFDALLSDWKFKNPNLKISHINNGPSSIRVTEKVSYERSFKYKDYKVDVIAKYNTLYFSIRDNKNREILKEVVLRGTEKSIYDIVENIIEEEFKPCNIEVKDKEES